METKILFARLLEVCPVLDGRIVEVMPSIDHSHNGSGDFFYYVTRLGGTPVEMGSLLVDARHVQILEDYTDVETTSPYGKFETSWSWTDKTGTIVASVYEDKVHFNVSDVNRHTIGDYTTSKEYGQTLIRGLEADRTDGLDVEDAWFSIREAVK